MDCVCGVLSLSVLSRRWAVVARVTLHSLNFEKGNGKFPGL
jgi:hypothetical protein